MSILFADLVGFTSLAEGRDAEETRELLSRYFDLAKDVVARYGGAIEKFIGDAVMAVWGAPTAHEDDAERAVRAALELVEAVKTLGPAIQARAGVLTGEAAVTLGATDQGMVAGDLVNTASRLQSVAPPGAVLVGEATHRAASRAIAFEEAGEQTLKGKASPVPTWRALRVVAEVGGRNRSETLEAPFVGRDDELRLLKDLFHATTREGRARLVSVIGPAGIGKTRLAWEFLKYIDGVVERVWYHDGRSPAYGEGITFWALGEMVRRRAGLLETDDEPTTRSKIAATLSEHVPDADERRRIEPALLTLLGVESATSGSEQLFGAWRTFFERLAATGLVVMVFEDFHYADSGLVDFVDHLLEWSRNVPIYVVTLARPELLEKRPNWGAGKRNFTSLYLEPLSEPAMRELLAGLVPGLPASAAKAIVDRADGMPLYAVETVRALLAEGRLALEDGTYRPIGDLTTLAVPDTLTALIASRLDGLPPDERALVAEAAVLGQSFTVAALAAVSGVTEAGLDPRLHGLVRRELLTLQADPGSPGRGQYAFVQALIREVAYNTLSKRDRKVRHLAAARYFENLGTDELAGGLAGHYLAAQRLAADPAEADALAAQARVALRGAAERASALGSYEQAITFLEQSLEITADPSERARLHAGVVTAARQGLDAALIIRHAEAAVVERRRTGDREAIALAVAEHGRAVRYVIGDPESALAILDAAWEEFSDLEHTPAGVELMSAIGSSHSGRNDITQAATWNDRYLPIAEQLGLLAPTTRGMISRGSGLLMVGRPREGIVLLRGAHQLALANDLRDLELQARVLMTFFEQWGEPAAGLALAREGIEIGQRLGSRAYGFQMAGNGSICALRTGDWEWAAALLNEWLAIDTVFTQQAEFFVDRAILRTLRGEDATADVEGATRLRVSGGITDPQWESYEHWATAWAAFVEGRFDEARRLGTHAVGLTTYFAPLAYPLVIRSALYADDAPGAAATLALMDASGYRGPALSADRLVATAGITALDGRRADALTLYREALRAWRELGLAWDEALCAVDMVLLLDPAEPEVRAAADSAREILTRLGAKPFLARLDTAMDRQPSAPTPEPARSRDPLTA